MTKYDEDKILYAIQNSSSKLEAINKLELSTTTGYRIVNKLIDKYNIDISHMTSLKWDNGKTSFRNRISLSDILTVDSTFTTSTLRERLIEEGIKEKRCESCNLVLWLGDSIPLELHHINGIRSDNRIENLQILCPNCHAKTPTYRGKNIVRVEKEIKKARRRGKEAICAECKKFFLKQNNRIKFCSRECMSSAKKKFIVSLEELSTLVYDKPVSQIAKEFNVTPNAIKKRCQKLGIEKPVGRACW